MAEGISTRKPPGKPKRGRPVGRDSETTRAEILRAARQVFGVRGYSATSMRMVAEQAGLSVTGVYYHFASRDHLYDEVVVDTASLLDGFTKEILAYQKLRPQLRALVFAMHRPEFQDRSVMAFLTRTYLDAARDPGLGGDTEPLLAGAERLFVTVVSSAISRGELPADTDVAATVGLLSSIMWGVGLYSGFVEDPDSMDVISAQVDDMFVHGLAGLRVSTTPPCLAG